jgi:transcriptional regulator with XRE-family HTH domain
MLVLMPELKDNLKRLRVEAGFTQQKLAEKSGLSISVVTQLERGIIPNPRLDTLRALAKALGCTLDQLTEADEATAPPAPKGKGKKGGE